MYEVVDLRTGELIETGFDTRVDAQRWLDSNNYDNENFGVSGGEEDDRDPWGFDNREVEDDAYDREEEDSL